MAQSRKLIVEIVGDSSSLQNTFGKAAKAGDSLGASMGRLAKGAAIAVGAAGIGGLAVVLKQGIGELSEASKVSAQTAAVLKSTGNAANVTAQQMDALSSSLMRKSGTDDEAIKSGQNLLLTFTNIRNEAGASNDIFNQTTEIMLDMSVALGQDMKSSAIQLGKALNDPVKGVTALQRVGVSFTESQRDQIKAMVEAGDAMGAQKLILAELNKEFGGSAEAYGRTLPGKINILKQSFNNLAGSMVSGLMPAFTRVVDGANRFIERLSNAKGAGDKFKVVLSTVASNVGGLLTGLVNGIRALDWGKAAAAMRDGFASAIDRVWGGALNTASGNPMHRQLDNGLKAAIDGIDWGEVGARIGEGIRVAVSNVVSIAKTLVDALNRATKQINWEELGRTMGPGFATMLLTAFKEITDPGFWIRNWDLMLAVALVAFSGPIGRAAGAITKPLLKFGDDMVIAIANGLERTAPRLAAAFLALFTSWPAAIAKVFASVIRIVVQYLGDLINKVGAAFGALGKLAVFTVKVLGLQAAINAVTNWAGQVAGKLADLASDAYGWAKEIGRQIIRGIGAGISGLVGWLLDQAGSVVGKVKDKLEFWKSPPKAYGKWIGEQLVQGLADGMADSVSVVVAGAKNVVAKVKQAIQEGRPEWKAAWAQYKTDVRGFMREWGDAAITAYDEQIARLQEAADTAARKLDLNKAVNQAVKDLDDAKLGVLFAGAKPVKTDLSDEQKQGLTDLQAEIDRLTAADPNLDPLSAYYQALQTVGPNAISAIQAQGAALDEWAAGVSAAQAEVTAAVTAQNEARKQLQDFYDNQAAIKRRNMFVQEVTDLVAQGQKLAGQHGLNQQAILNKIGSFEKRYRIAGSDAGEALARGIEDAAGKVRDAADSWGRAVAAALRKAGVTVRVVSAEIVEVLKSSGNPMHMAAGGPVSARTPYVVGERGPELFVPQLSGRIVPNSQLRSSTGGTAIGGTVNVYVTGFLGPGAEQELARVVKRELMLDGKRNVSALGGLA